MNIFHPPTPKAHDTLIQWHQLNGSSDALAIASMDYSGLKVVVAPDIHKTHQLAHELAFFSPNQPISMFPDWEVLPYDHFSPHEDIISQRLQTLNALNTHSSGTVIVAISTLMHRLAPKTHTLAQSFWLKVGDSVGMPDFCHKLISAGYQHRSEVWHHGEFTKKGSIIDVFPSGSENPIRIEWFDDQIYSLRTFDPHTQCTIKKTSQIDLLPAQEFPLTEEGINFFRRSWRNTFEHNPKNAPIYTAISEGMLIGGIEYYIPLFYEKTLTLFDYLPEKCLFFTYEDIYEHAQSFHKTVNNRYEQLHYDTSRPLLEPSQLFISPDQVFSAFKSHTRINIVTTDTKSNPKPIGFSTAVPADMAIDHHRPDGLLQLGKKLPRYKRIIFCTESLGRQETLKSLLIEHNFTPKVFDSWQDAINSIHRIVVVTAPIEQGFLIENCNTLIITENELWKNHVKQKRLRKKSQQDPSAIIKSLMELKTHDPVVHTHYGVGRYLGLQTITTGKITAEYLALEYANHDKVYIPVSSLDLISRYTGADADHAPLQRLGTSQWQQAKEKASKKIRDTAAELLDLYSKRSASPGFQFTYNEHDYRQFRDEFLFEETEDQTQAIQAVIHDMTQEISMDRLVCGDVGFGKTEVAMQACFIATQSNKQIAILVPTTLLARQHYQNFCDRFANWPIKIGVLSRLQTAKEQTTTLANMANGKMDIVIGTHRLLSANIKFKDLGLLIVDEEHRFGVRHKEKIKTIRANIDILTLTATPIPRTLNMAMSGTRDLSIIATPPQKRLSIKTFIYERNEAIVREAISREILRGGQVYFLHNNIHTMAAEKEKLQASFPQARIVIAHGQMRERQIEQVMSDFYHQKFHVLLTTTIIESGIDVPTANTILIDRADRFGLAQLHQIRGRVGRSHHQAYAYFLIPNRKAITKDAIKRLDAIASLEDLGAGFTLATHDLEIRGAGELLGEQQCGHMQAIGFSLYLSMLEHAVASLKSGTEPDFDLCSTPEITVEIGANTLFPDAYIPDAHLRLLLYKRLAECTNEEGMHELKAELIDRFGRLPIEAEHLFLANQLKLQAKRAGIERITLTEDNAILVFSPKPNIQADKIISLIQSQPKNFQLKNKRTLKWILQQNKIDQRVTQTIQLINQIML